MQRLAPVAIVCCLCTSAAADPAGPEGGVLVGGALPTAEHRREVDDPFKPALGLFGGYAFGSDELRVAPGIAASYSRFGGDAYRGSWLLITPRVQLLFGGEFSELSFDAGLGYSRATSEFRANPDEPWTERDPETSALGYSLGSGLSVPMGEHFRVGARLSLEGLQLARSGFLLYGMHQVGANLFVASRLSARAAAARSPSPEADARWFVSPSATAGWLEPIGCDFYCRGTPAFGLGLAGGARVSARLSITGTGWAHIADREELQLFVGPGAELDAVHLWVRASAGVGYRDHHDADGTPQDSVGLALSAEIGRELERVGRRSTDLVMRAGYQPGTENDTLSVTAGLASRWR